jgi:hypothetical protein
MITLKLKLQNIIYINICIFFTSIFSTLSSNNFNREYPERYYILYMGLGLAIIGVIFTVVKIVRPLFYGVRVISILFLVLYLFVVDLSNFLLNR